MSKPALRIMFVALITTIYLGACGSPDPLPTQAPLTPIFQPSGERATPLPPVEFSRQLTSDLQGCFQGGELINTLILPDSGICFLYPTGFNLQQPVQAGLYELRGDPFIDTVPAEIELQISEAGDISFEAWLDEIIESSETPLFETEIVLDEQPAVILEEIPGEVPARLVLAQVNGLRYRFTLSPSGEAYPEAARELIQGWDTIAGSLQFFPPEAADPTPEPVDTRDWIWQEYNELGYRLKLPPDWEVTRGQARLQFAPPGAAEPWLELTHAPELPGGDLTELTNQLTTTFQDQGEPETEIRDTSLHNIAGVSFLGRPGQCQDTYLPAYETVYRVILLPGSCLPALEPTPTVVLILNSLQIFRP